MAETEFHQQAERCARRLGGGGKDSDIFRSIDRHVYGRALREPDKLRDFLRDNDAVGDQHISNAGRDEHGGFFDSCRSHSAAVTRRELRLGDGDTFVALEMRPQFGARPGDQLGGRVDVALRDCPIDQCGRSG